MKNHLWFKAKNVGWGWYPSSWQGWIILFIYIVGLILIFPQPYLPQYLTGGVVVFCMTTLLIVICYKTGEKPEWRWGNWGKKKKST